MKSGIPVTFKPKHKSLYSLLILLFAVITSCSEQQITSQLDQSQNSPPHTVHPVISATQVQTQTTQTPNTEAGLSPSPTPELEALFIYNQGIRAFRVEEYNDAITSFNMVIKRLPQLALGYKARGGAYYELEKYDRAKEDLEKAIEIDPNIGGAYLYLGLVYLAQENQSQAKVELEKAMRLIHPIREKWEYKQAEKVFLNLD